MLGRRFFRLRLWFGTHRGQGLVLLAGFALIVVGVLCLCTSALVVDTGSWWQGTLDAFGVGFIVGGVVDVLAIFQLNNAIKAEDQEREKFNGMARDILQQPAEDAGARFTRFINGGNLLYRSRGLMDQDLKVKLAKLVDADNDFLEPLIARFPRRSQQGFSLDGLFDNMFRLPPEGDAPRETEAPEPPDHPA
jgi:hypothetical protein